MGIDLIMMLSSTVLGYVFKFMANAQQDKAEAWNRMIGTMKQEEVMLESARNFKGGTWVRRFIVLMSFLIFFMLTVGSGFIDGATTMINEISIPWFYGGGTEIEVTEINGMLYTKDITIILYAIIGFYFGSSAATRR